VKSSLLAEIRDWLESVAAWISLYLAWRWRPRKRRGDVTIDAPPANAVVSIPKPAILNLSPAHGVVSASASLALTIGDHAGAQAVLDSMAELDSDFPQF
jgi:hypothetical protein